MLKSNKSKYTRTKPSVDISNGRIFPKKMVSGDGGDDVAVNRSLLTRPPNS